MKQPQCIIVTQFHLALSPDELVPCDSQCFPEWYCMIFHGQLPILLWFAFVFITFPIPDCQKGMDFFCTYR